MKNHRSYLLVIPLALAGLLGWQEPIPVPAPGPALSEWFRLYDFEAAVFQRPPLAFGPFTRWWWPGNDVTNDELQREVRLFAEHGFAGVEIQPFTMGVGERAATPGVTVAPDRIQRINSWDTPSFYEHVRAVMTQAQQSGLTVDLAAGSGWPLGGPGVPVQDGMLTLSFADTLLPGGQLLQLPVPLKVRDNTGIKLGPTPLYAKVDPKLAQLVAVVAARRGRQSQGQVYLEPASVIDISRYVSNHTIRWQAPASGPWNLIAVWAIPDGERPALIASQDRGFVVNHLDSLRMAGVYAHLFGTGTGLPAFAGRPFRAVFNDSYEFKPDRHYTSTLLATFRQRRGYDPIPWLPANLQRGYNMAYDFLLPVTRPEFVFTSEDWRLRYDYDLTVSDLIREQLVEGSNHWLGRHGLAHRTQAYGAKMDIMAATGAATLPETEQLWNGGSEGALKLVASGAHLYNRPLLSCEALVFQNRSEMITPQKLKIAADKAFTAGVTQLVYHGTPYRYEGPEFGPEGWKAFAPRFSTSLNEQDAYWPNIKELNTYVTRAQYALRAGRPKADVLLYFPFLDFTDRGITPNPEEILVNGYLAGVEPEISLPEPARTITPSMQWFARVWPVINQLQAAGLTWEFVNDASLQVATLQHGQLSIRGNSYAALVLAHAPYLQLASAQNVERLTAEGARLLVVGAVPTVQPSFLNYQLHDQLTHQALRRAAAAPTARVLPTPEGVGSWARTLPNQVKFGGTYSFLRQIQRDMTDNSRLQFLWNQTGRWQVLTLQLDSMYQHNYWLNPEDGRILPAPIQSGAVSYTLPPYGSIMLYARPAGAALAAGLVSLPRPTGQLATEVLHLSEWNLQAGPAVRAKTPLFDWRTEADFQYAGAVGKYTTAFTLARKTKGKRYFIDLGEVYFTAEVKVNGQLAGRRLYAPYQLEISSLLRKGTNQVEVEVTPTQRNVYIGRGLQGIPQYQAYRALAGTLMPAGLVGPVSIRML